MCFGIALAYSTVDSPWAFRRCDDAGQWRDFCRHDVNGEIAVVNVELGACQLCQRRRGLTHSQNLLARYR